MNINKSLITNPAAHGGPQTQQAQAGKIVPRNAQLTGDDGLSSSRFLQQGDSGVDPDTSKS